MNRLFVLALAAAACKPASQPAVSGAPRDAGSMERTDSKALLAEVDRLKDQVKSKPKSFEVLCALGNLYYENGRYLEAVDAFREAEELARPALAQQDALRRKRI